VNTNSKRLLSRRWCSLQCRTWRQRCNGRQGLWYKWNSQLHREPGSELLYSAKIEHRWILGM